MIPYGKHKLYSDDIDAVVDVLQNHFLTQGNKVPEFEKALCDYTGAKYSVAVNSATSGLHIACLAAGVGTGDTVWTTPNSFVATANCALYCGAKVDFIDMDPVTRNIDLNKLASKVSEAKKSKNLPKAIIAVHFAGFSCDMQRISDLFDGTGVVVIEDAAHGLGGAFRGTKIGSCQYSDMSIFSFHPVKSITTAEGGAVLTNNGDLAQKLTLFAKHGVTRDRDFFDLENELYEEQGPWYYQQLVLGYNYRLSDLQAALGISQLNRLDEHISARRRCANFYFDKLKKLPLILPAPDKEQQSGWHLFMVELSNNDDTDDLKLALEKRKDIFLRLQEKGIGVNVHYIPIHLHPYYRNLGFSLGDYPNSERFYSRAITLPLYPTLTISDQQRVVDALTDILL